jgi:heme/copper-type cytochrome/quinol oxidase subunit 1
MFCIRWFTGLLLANAALDLSFHDTYFVIGHFHYVLSIAAAAAAAALGLFYLL